MNYSIPDLFPMGLIQKIGFMAEQGVSPPPNPPVLFPNLYLTIVMDEEHGRQASNQVSSAF